SAPRHSPPSAPQAAVSAWIRFTARGSWKLTVPTPTALAPASSISTASVPVVTPPVPMTRAPGRARVTSSTTPALPAHGRPGQAARDLCHHPQLYRLDRRPGVPAGDAAEQRAPKLGVDP